MGQVSQVQIVLLVVWKSRISVRFTDVRFGACRLDWNDIVTAAYPFKIQLNSSDFTRFGCRNIWDLILISSRNLWNSCQGQYQSCDQDSHVNLWSKEFLLAKTWATGSHQMSNTRPAIAIWSWSLIHYRWTYPVRNARFKSTYLKYHWLDDLNTYFWNEIRQTDVTLLQMVQDSQVALLVVWKSRVWCASQMQDFTVTRILLISQDLGVEIETRS